MEQAKADGTILIKEGERVKNRYKSTPGQEVYTGHGNYKKLTMYHSIGAG